MSTGIYSEMAKRRTLEGMQTSSSNLQDKASVTSTSPAYPSHGKPDTEAPRQPASLGKLQEIDLGEEVRSRNVELTERAKRKLGGEEVEEEEAATTKAKKGKVRLGPDGKPWRGRKRRGSDDVKRDRLVEDVMRENRLEIYSPPPAPPSTNAKDAEGAADERIAEAFRKEFMDAVQQRQQKKKVQQTTMMGQGAAGGKKEEETLKGPKLGGSRNARAAVREALLKGKK